MSVTSDENHAAEPAEETAGSRSGAQTLERGLELLDLAVSDPAPVAELARRAGLSRHTAYRLVNALIASDFLAWSAEGRIRAGGRLLRLGTIAQNQNDLVSIARPHLHTLSDKTGLCAFLGRRDGDYSLHLFRNAGTERLAVNTQPGSRRLLSETGIGKALLLDDDASSWRRLFGLAATPQDEREWLPKMHLAAANGIILQHGAPPDSINSVAAPIRDASGRIIAAVNVAAAAQYLSPERMIELDPTVRQIAADISRELGWRGEN